MNAKQLKELYNSYKNSNSVIDVGGKHQEFVSSMLVNVASMNEPDRDLINSQPQDVFQTLLEKITTYLDEYYIFDNSYAYKKKIYQIAKVDDEVKDEEKRSHHRRVFCYVSFEKTLVRKQKDLLGEKEEQIVFQQVKNYLDFTPSEKEKKSVIEKIVPPTPLSPSIITETGFTGASDNEGPLDYYRNWYLCTLESASTNIIYEGLNKILQLKQKKGSWISGAAASKKIELDPLQNKQSVETYLSNIKITIISELVAKIYESNLLDFENKTFLVGFDLESDEASVKNFPDLSLYEAAIYFKPFVSTINNQKNYIIGFTKNIIDAFPDLSPLDYKKFEISDEITFENFEDITNTLKSLEKVIDDKISALGDQGFEIVNYDPEKYIKEIKQFVSKLKKEVENQNIDVNSPFKFSFSRTKCEVPDIKLPDYTPQKAIQFQECQRVFVEGQTNLLLSDASSLKDKSSSLQIKYLYSTDIDNQIIGDLPKSAYLFANSKKIINDSDSYSPKDFFTNLVYQKTKYEKKQNLSLSVFYDSAKASFQQSFVTDAVNLVKFSKIKDNILRKNAANKNISQIVGDVIDDIQNIKQLYEVIMYRYDVKDLADEVLSCYAKNFADNNPQLAKFIKGTVTFVDTLTKFLKEENESFSKIVNCMGIVIPKQLGQIPGSVFVSPKEFFENEIKNKIQLIGANVTDLDGFAALSIRCFETFYSDIVDPETEQKVKKLIEDYRVLKEIYTLAKEQFQYLKAQARIYRKNPGTKESLKKKTKGFISQALDNAWILLQRQAAREAEKLIVETIKIFLKKLLETLKNNCKPNDSKDKNSNKPIGNPGDLVLGTDVLSLTDPVIELLSYLSGVFDPEKLCSIFYGSADDDTYEQVLSIISGLYPTLYSNSPITFSGVVLSNEPLSTAFIVKNFLLSLSVEFPGLTTIKCDNYFEDLSNSPLNIEDEQKCIDFSEKYKNEKISSLVKRGFTEAQAKKIVEAQLNAQLEKYDQLFEQTKNGIYNELTKEYDEKKVPVADFVKDKVQKQLNQLTNSMASFIDLEKQQFLFLSDAIQKPYTIQQEDISFFPILPTEAQQQAAISVKANLIEFVIPSDVSEAPLDILIEPIYFYGKSFKYMPYAVKFASDKYIIQKNNESADYLLAVKQFVSSKLLSKNILGNELFRFIGQDQFFNERFFWLSIFQEFLIKTSFDIIQNYNQQNYDFANSPFDSEIILSNVNELINFEE